MRGDQEDRRDKSGDKDNVKGLPVLASVRGPISHCYG